VHRRTFLATTAAAAAMTTVSGQALAATGNPLLPAFTGPHGGLPPFDRIKTADFAPALDEAIAINRKEIAAIVATCPGGARSSSTEPSPPHGGNGGVLPPFPRVCFDQSPSPRRRGDWPEPFLIRSFLQYLPAGPIGLAGHPLHSALTGTAAA